MNHHLIKRLFTIKERRDFYKWRNRLIPWFFWDYRG